MTDLRTELAWLVEQFKTYLWCVEHEWGGPIEKYQAEEARAEAILSMIDANDALSEEQMLGPFFKEYADLGHWFDKAHGKCIRCGTATIDLFEDGIYGDIRPCPTSPSLHD